MLVSSPVAFATAVSVFIISGGQWAAVLYTACGGTWLSSVSFSSAFYNMVERSVQQALLEKASRVC